MDPVQYILSFELSLNLDKTFNFTLFFKNIFNSTGRVVSLIKTSWHHFLPFI